MNPAAASNWLLVRTSKITVAFAMLAVPSLLTFGRQTCIWTGGTGNWSDASHWSCGIAPNNGANVFIDNGNMLDSIVSLDQDAAIGTLTVDAEDSLMLQPQRQLRPMTGQVVNNGTIRLASGGANLGSTLDIRTPTLFSGTGEIVLERGSAIRALGVGNGAITNGAGHTIRGTGQLGSPANNVMNLGTIVAAAPGLSIRGFTNSGTVLVPPGASAAVVAGSSSTVTNSGMIQIESTGVFSMSGVQNLTETAGRMTIDGTLSLGGTLFDVAGGVVDGIGQIAGDSQPRWMFNEGGVVAPGGAGTIGTLSLTDALGFDQSQTGALSLEIAGTASGQADQLTTTHTTFVRGTLEVFAIGGYVPRVHDRIAVVTATQFGSGAPATIHEHDFPPGLRADFLRSGSTGYVVVVRSADMNCDARLNNFDIDPFVTALTQPATYTSQYPSCEILNADVNRDGVLNNFDIDPFVACLIAGGCP